MHEPTHPKGKVSFEKKKRLQSDPSCSSIFLITLITVMFNCTVFYAIAKDWVDNEFTFINRDCAMTTITFAGTVIDENAKPIPNAKVDVVLRGVPCERREIYPIVYTDQNGKFSVSRVIYMGFYPREYTGPHEYGFQEITISAWGYKSYVNNDKLSVSGSYDMTVVLKR